MNMVLISPDEIDPSGDFLTAELSGRRFRHLLEVLKIDRRSGICKIGVLNGMTGTGECMHLDHAAGKIRLKLNLDTPPPVPPPVTLAAALPRPKTFRKVLHCAISMGVKKLWFFGAFKVDKSYWQSPMLSGESLQEEIALALEQSGDTAEPEIKFRRFFKPFAEDELPGIAAGSRLLIAHPEGADICPVLAGEPVTLCVGPEGGFTDYEVDLLRKAGGEAVTLGTRILRTEVALPALLGRII